MAMINACLKTVLSDIAWNLQHSVYIGFVSQIQLCGILIYINTSKD